MATIAERIEIRDILVPLKDILRDSAVHAGGAVIGLVAINLLLDRLPSQAGVNIGSSLVSVGAQYYLTTTILEQLERRSSSRNRFVGLWWLGAVSGLGIGLGLVLLIAPGLYLAARWSVAAPVMFAEDIGAYAAMSRSAALTRTNIWPILAVLFLSFVPPILLAGGAVLLFQDWQPLLASALAYLFLFGALVLCWLAAIAIYLALTPPSHDDLAELFA